MKKFFAIAAVVAVALTSCVKNEVITPNEEINFKAVNYKNTKAGVYGPISGTAYDGETFGVFAFPSNNTGVAYMDNVEISEVSTDTWKNAAQSYYWPKDGVTLDFACYSPYNLAPCSGTVTATYNKGIDIADFTTTTTLNKQVDLMVADLIPDKNSGPVAVPFKHVLSQVKFTVAPQTANMDIDAITITSVKFTVNSVADYASTDGTFANSAWSGWATPVDYEALAAHHTVDLTNTTAVDLGTPVLIIPQDVVDITVKYTIDYGAYDEECEVVYKHTAATPAQTWKKNYIYTYNLVVGLNEILFSPSVEAWADDDALTGGWE